MEWEPGALGHLTGVHAGATRPVVIGAHGAVGSAHWAASLEGLRTLQEGGNAFDAAITTAAVIGVVEPFMSGIGGCGGAVCYDAASGEYRALDFNGRAPGAALPGRWARLEDMTEGFSGALVPGVIAGWDAIWKRYGSLPWDRLLAPAIRLAEEGAPVSILTRARLVSAAPRLRQDPGLSSVFVPSERPLDVGHRLVQTSLGRTLRQIGREGARTFYEGAIASAIAESCQRGDGLLTCEDLADYEALWLPTANTTYRGRTVHTLPPPFGSMQLLETLRLVEGFDLPELEYQGTEHLHLLIQAIKIARNDKNRYAHSAGLKLDELFSEQSIASRRKTIDLHQATPSLGERAHAAAQPRLSPAGHTTHLVAADAAGNMISLTQTLGHLFGAVVSIDDLGITLNDMAFWFDLDPSSPNVIAPRKRQTSPISPVIVNDKGGRRIAIGTPGGFGIPQTTAQMLTGLIDFGLSPQTVVESPRFRVDEGVSVSFETRVPAAVLEALRRMGHDIVEVGPWLWDVQPSRGDLGRASIAIYDSQARALFAASDPRGDGLAAAW